MPVPARAEARGTRAGSSLARGFTLIELLVVISIVALLIAILLPTLTKARATAESVQCLSNLRQQGILMFTYAQDNKQYPAGIHADRVRHFNSTVTWGRPYATGQGASTFGLLFNQGYFHDNRLVYCPGRPDSDTMVYNNGGGITHPNWTNGSGLHGGWIAISYWVATSDIGRDGTGWDTNPLYYFGEWQNYDFTPGDAPQSMDFWGNSRGSSKHGHGEGYNTLFFDSSARFVGVRPDFLDAITPGNEFKPWVYNSSNGHYRLMTEGFGWTDAHFRKVYPQF